MKKLLLLTFLVVLSFNSYSQDYVSNEEIKIDAVRSKFSVGISPIVFIPVNDYNSNPGLGLELMPLYGLNNNFSIGAFLKIKAELNPSALSPPGSGYSGNGTLFENGSGSIGGIFEYKMFNKIAVNLRLGVEDFFVRDSNDPGLIYGGGFSLYISRDESKRVVHSFNWGINFESNNFTNIDMLDISTNEFESTEVNAFYIQFGWRMQFHSVDTKR